jgi:outer membrane protein OmpA-like peptidoglycan-associated protein
MKKFVLFILWVAVGILFSVNSRAQDLQEMLQVLTPNLPAKVTHQEAGEDKLIVSVMDGEGNPVKGLGIKDFAVQKNGREAQLISVESLETSEDVGLNVILVLDNSDSMKLRDTIGPLLSALDEFLKIVRPIDNIHAVVFDPTGGVQRNDRTLHVKDIHSQDVGQLKLFFDRSFDEDLSIKTFLYEGILAAFDIAGKMPAKENKLVVIFSDGEDLNSRYDTKVVEAQARTVENVQVYAIDHMPGKTMDPFLKSFAETHRGRIWKAVSANELVPIFQALSSTLRHQYVITYRFLKPPEGTVGIFPGRLDLEMLTLADGSPVSGYIFFEKGLATIPSWYTLLPDKASTENFDETRLTDVVERFRNILNIVGRRLSEKQQAAIRIVGYSGPGTEKEDPALGKGRAESVAAYLAAVWGVSESRMTVEAQTAAQLHGPQGDLTAEAESRRVVVEFLDPDMQARLASDFIVESAGHTEISVRPLIVAEYGVAQWELTVLGDDRPLFSSKSEGELKLVHSVSLDKLDKRVMAMLGALKAQIHVIDTHGDGFTPETEICPITVKKTSVLDALIPPLQAGVTMKPEAITIEEVTMIDSSPTLNYIFFDENNSELPGRYVLLTSRQAAEQFDETRLKGAMEKYAHVLNVVGKRLTNRPEAKITLVGCNSDYEVEKGRIDLSRSRAEAIRGYLKYLWGIDFSRMEVKAQNLPKALSTNRIPEGRAENQRVEIHSDTPEILDTTMSTYIEEMSDAEAITIETNVQAGFGVDHWKLDVKGDDTVLKSLTGTGKPESVYSFKLMDLGLKTSSGFRNLIADLEVVDDRGEALKAWTASPTSLRFIKREERLSQKKGYRVLEKYALILFDYDSAKIRGRNEEIVGRILARVKELPDASVRIVGHTDTIGEEKYNLALSEKRAKAVYDALSAAGLGVATDVLFSGVGPNDPLYDNALPEGRSFNRTVTITLEYDKRD